MTTLRLILVFATLLAGAHPAAADDRHLNIVVFGATGEVGSHIVNEALGRGHNVRAISRRPESVERQHENLTVMKGDLLDPASIQAAVTDQDVVVISVRGVIGTPGIPQNALQFIAARSIVNALGCQPDRDIRLLHVGGSGSLVVEPGVLYADKIPNAAINKKLETEIAGQILALQFFRQIDWVNWTYLTPPKNFTNGPRTGVYRIGGDEALEDDRGRTRVSRADFAVALIDEAENARYPQQRISIAY
ncbi:MAG: NAD(P)H-binding protein [Pseudomonadota bacterium]